MRWWLNRRRRTGGDSVSDTVDATNGRRHNVGTAVARTAGRGRDEAQSLAATIWQRRPSDQLTPSHRPQLDGDAREREHVSQFTDNSGRHSISSGTHTDGSASAHPSSNSDSHSDSQSDNFVNDYWVTFIHPLSSASWAQFQLHCVSVTQPSHSLLTQNVSTPLSHSLYTAWLSQSSLNSIWFNSTRHALVRARSCLHGHMNFSRRPDH